MTAIRAAIVMMPGEFVALARGIADMVKRP